MALLVKDRIKETTSTTGTGTLTLAGAATGYQAFSVLGNGTTTYYALTDANGTAWEVGLGTYTLSGTTLARTTVLDSSNSGSAISLTSGTHDVFVTYPAGKAGFNDQGLDKTFTADGAITAGKPCILTAAGKASQIASSTSRSSTPTVGSVTAMNGTATCSGFAKSIYDSTSGSFIMAYKDTANSSYPTAVAGTMSSGTMTWGTPVVAKTSACQNAVAIAIGNGRLWAVWEQTSTETGRISSATISGTTINAFATDVEATPLGDSGHTTKHMVYDTDSDYLVLFYGRNGKSYVKPLYTQSNGTITAGTAVEIDGSSTQDHMKSDIVYDPDTNRTIIVYSDLGSSQEGTVQVVQSSGTTGSPTLTVGTAAVFDSGDIISYLSCCYDTVNNKVFITYANSPDYEVKGVIGTVTGGGTNSIAFAGYGVIHDFSSGAAPYFDTIYDSDAEKIMYFHRDQQDGDDTYYAVITPGASSFSVATAVEISTDDNQMQSGSGSFGAGKGTLLALQNGSSSNKVSSVTSYFAETTTTNLDNNYLGVASTTASDAADVNINLPDGSINNSQTGLTVGEDYFSDISGTVRTFVSGGSALSTGQYLGKALSATALELKDQDPQTIYGMSEGAVTKGKPVIVEADGDFAQVTGSTTSVALINSGVQNIATSGADDKYNLATDGSGIICAVWKGSSNYPYCAIGNVTSTGTTLTWGTPVALRSAGCTTASVYYSSGLSHFVGMHIDTAEGGSDDQFATKIEFSGTAATCTNIGGATGYGLGTTSNHSVSFYDSTEATGFTFYGDATSKIMLLTDTQIGSTGYRGVSSLVGSSASDCARVGLAWDQTNNVGVAWWQASANSDYPTVRAFTVSGTGNGSITMGTAVVLESNGTNAYGGIACGAPNSAEFVAVWKESTTELRYNTMTLSGTTITIGTAGALSREGSEEYYVEGTQLLTYNQKSKKYYFVYNDSDDDLDVMVKEMSYSSGSLTVDSTTKVIDGTAVSTYYWNILYTGGMTSASEASMVLIGKRDSNDVATAQYCPAYSYSTTNLTTENYIGIAQETASDNATTVVQTVGATDNNQSSLTPGQTYYVQEDGTLALTADTTSVVAGQAISATKLLISRS